MNLKEVKPSRPYDFYIDRRSPVGNPYPLKKETYRDLVCDYYEDHFNRMVEMNDTLFVGYLETLLKTLETHNNLRLFCWCTPKRCHGETIKRYLEKCQKRRLY